MDLAWFILKFAKMNKDPILANIIQTTSISKPKLQKFIGTYSLVHRCSLVIVNIVHVHLFVPNISHN